MDIKQFRYGDTNLGYLLWSGTEAVAIDGGAASEILEFCGEESLTLEYVLNTHEHWDHVPGNDQLLDETAAQHIRPYRMCELKVLSFGGVQLEAFPAPGHSEDSIIFYFNDDEGGALLTGDTLFNGTVGNCYTKNYEQYFESLLKVLRFPGETRIFAGHDIFDYTTGVMDEIEPDNPHLPAYRLLYSKDILVTTIAQEKKVNPFIRFDDDALDNFRAGLGMPVGTAFERWRAMMSVH